MNIISPKFIRDFLLDYLPEGRFVSGGDEYIIPSLFLNYDPKCHMSVNTQTGLWRCFKTSNTGNFISLYSKIKKISYIKAEAELYLIDLFSEESKQEIEHLPFAQPDDECDLGINLIKVDLENPSEEGIGFLCWETIVKRKLYDENDSGRFLFYYSDDETFSDRLIVPYIKNGKLIFFTGRSLVGQSPKYLSSKLPRGVSQENIVYPFDTTKDYVVVCEGPVDAISLQIQGVNATSTQTNLVTKEQAALFRNWGGKIILGYDNDKAGRQGLKSFERLRLKKRMENFYVCHPPKKFKDWNAAHQADFDLQSYVNNNIVKYDFEYCIMSELN